MQLRGPTMQVSFIDQLSGMTRQPSSAKVDNGNNRAPWLKTAA